MAMALLAGLAPPAFAQDPEAGREIATRLCSRCHAIASGEASPAANAPAFPTLGRRWPLGALREALAEGIVVGHSEPPMPEFSFTPRRIDDLIAYLETVAAAGE